MDSLLDDPCYDCFAQQTPRARELQIAPMPDESIIATDLKESQGESVSISDPSKRKRQRQRFNPTDREKVKRVRRIGACLRCRMYKEKVFLTTSLRRCLRKVV